MESIKTTEFIESYLDGIAKGQSVLLLGPRFGVTEDGRHVHQVVKEEVLAFYQQKTGQDPLLTIDTAFDNLFIFKKNGGPHELLELRFKLRSFYEGLRPHQMYKAIAQMPFKGIINCSPDLLLKKTLDELEIPHAFHYYSPKGQIKQDEANDLPVLLNLFGRCDNPETFIVNYEDFFKFVMSIMGDENQIPLNLKNLLTDASFFILMGFDMDKWYVPLIVRKLNQGKERSRFTVLSKDNTFSVEDEQRLSTTLLLLEDEALPVISMLNEKLKAIGSLRKTGNSDSNLLSALNHLLIEDKLDELLKMLIPQATKLGLQEHELYATSAALAGIERDFLKTIINASDYQTGRGRVRESLKDTLKDLGKNAIPIP